MNFYEWINIGIGIIGVIVGMVGLKSLNTATKIKNKLENVHNSTIQQAQTITINNNGGMDS